MKIPKLEDLPLVEVRNNRAQIWVKRRLMIEADTGKFVCIDGKWALSIWNQMQEIKEPQMRKANRDEWMYWACSADALGWVVKIEEEAGEDYYHPQWHSYLQYDCENCMRAKMTPKGPREFEYFMVPVEVEE